MSIGIELASTDAEDNSFDILAEEASVALFAGVALLSAVAVARSGRPKQGGASPVNTGLQMRRLLVVALLVANVVRCLSILGQLSFQDEAPLPVFDGLSQDQLRWVQDLIALLPAVVFLSAFSVIALFWAQLHYTTTIVSVPVKCFFVCVNIACYLLVAAVAVCTFLLRAYTHMRTYMTFIIGFLNAVVAVTFCYYGFISVYELSESAKKKIPGRKLTHRVVILSVICPCALLGRGACYLAWGLSLGRPSTFADLCLCLAGEWLPSVATLVVLQPWQSRQICSVADSLDDSTDSEAPYEQLNDAAPPRSMPGASQWKQLYPPLKDAPNT